MAATLARSAVFASPAKAVDPHHVSVKTWICVCGVMLGCFMAVLNIIVTNSSLRDIAGTLGASSDEVSWVPTAYLVAEIVVIPLTGWLSRAFSLRNYLLVNSILFLIFSVACGQTRSLELMILFRVLQGFCGGVLIPLAFNVILTYLPRSKQPIGMALYGLTATFAPAVGPLIGGYLTEQYGWPTIFYLNIVPGLLLIAAVWFTMERSPTQLHLLKKGDWLGIITMVIGLSSLEIVLEDGNRKDWLGDANITRLAIAAVVFLTAFIVVELSKKDPLVDLRLFGRRNFGLGGIVNVALGIGLYGAVYIIPAYLGQVHGYNSLQIGQTLIWMGLPQLLLIPCIPWLMKRVDARILIGIGVLLFGGSSFLTSSMDGNFAGPQFVFPLIVRALGQPFIMVPLSALATAGMAKGRESSSASALFNMMRNLGGSFGIAGLSTLLSVRERFHSVRIGESVSLYAQGTRDRLSNAAASFTLKGADAATAHMQAVILIDRSVRRQAFLMSYNDCFVALGILLLLSGVAIFMMKKADLSGAGGGAH